MVKNQLNILLGAGFSFHSGVPLVKGIDNYFYRNLNDKLLRHSSGEWQWVDNKGSATINNGRIGFDYIYGEFFLETLIEDYIKNHESRENYEILFQYFLEASIDKRWIDDMNNITQKKIKEELSEESFEFNRVNSIYFNRSDMIYLMNELISDLLVPNKTYSDYYECYNKFLEFISKYEKVNIFTLNHDTLLELLLLKKDIQYTDGFSVENSIIEYEGEPQPSFQNMYKETGIRIFKLHGCKSVIPCIETNVTDGYIHTPTGKIIYFRPKSHSAKHFAKIKDSHQAFNFITTPFLVTGKEKIQIIENNEMFNSLFHQFKDNMDKRSDMLIIGYSFFDEHINTIIKNGKYDKIINVNPHVEYKYKHENITELKDITNLE